jgi:adenine-specific DNA-methyltransferase
MEFDLVYVNGDNNLMNLPMAPEGGEPPYKVRLIEEEFQRLMFDVKDVE